MDDPERQIRNLLAVLSEVIAAPGAQSLPRALRNRIESVLRSRGKVV